MGKLTEGLKLILEGLAYQDAADYLSTEQKLEVLGIESPYEPATSRRPSPGWSGRRIALISDSGAESPALDFALSACQRYAAELDLVSLGATSGDEGRLRKLSHEARLTGTQVCQVHLPPGRAEALRDYVRSHPSLIYLVASVADDLACGLAQRILRTAGTHVPLVLVRGHP